MNDGDSSTMSTEAAFFTSPEGFRNIHSASPLIAPVRPRTPSPYHWKLTNYFSGFVLYVCYHVLYVAMIWLLWNGAVRFVVKCLPRRLGSLLRHYRRHKCSLSGMSHAYSAINILDPSFDTPNYFPAEEFPSPSGGVNAHFLMMMSKLVYEHPAVVHDVAVNKWGFKRVQMLNNEEDTVQGFVFTSTRARVIAFKGPSLATLVRFKLTDTPDLGRVHHTWLRCLFDVPGTQSLAHRLLWVLMVGREVDGVPTFVAGHSTGGAIASIFTAFLMTRGVKTGGLYTYGQPRCGDDAYVSVVNGGVTQGLLGECVRVVNDSDVVPMIPLSLEYSHHMGFTLLHGDGKVTTETTTPDEKWVKCGKIKPHQLIRNCFMKALRTPIDESGVRSLVRLMFFLFPGLNDHLPCDYERGLRQNVCMVGSTPQD
eukprot:PhF_6_TR18583/c0_g1_i1/m.27148